MALQLEGRLRETLERLKSKDLTSSAAAAAAGNSVGNSNHLEAMLQQLLSIARAQASRLAKLETGCFSSPGAGTSPKTGSDSRIPVNQEQEVTSQEHALDGVLAALQQTRVGLEEVLRSSRQRYLPAGEQSISPPAIYVSVFTCGFLCQHHPKQTSTFKFSSALTHSAHASSKIMRLPSLLGFASQIPTTNPYALSYMPFPLPLSVSRQVVLK